MVNVYLNNQTDKPVFVTGFKGTDWGQSVIHNGVAPKGFAKVGAMTDATGTSTPHWGWIYIGFDVGRPSLQLYVATGVSGVYDYAVQYYDRGLNRNGDTIAQTKVEKTKDGVTFTVSFVPASISFDPWMSRIPADRLLHQITIPGTHDSGTRGLAYPSETQTATIEEQLMMGIRFFDIRVDSSSNALRVVHGSAHGSGNTDLYFTDVAEMFSDFLSGKQRLQSTEETVIMQVKNDRGGTSGLHDEIVKQLKKAFKGEEDRLYLKPIRLAFNQNSPTFGTIPSIGDLRGKLVLLRRYDYDKEDDLEAGTPVKYFASGSVYNNWTSNPGSSDWLSCFNQDNFEWPNSDDNISHFGSLIDYRNRHGLSFVIQDQYQKSDYGTFAEKYQKFVKKYLNKASQGMSPDSWFLNFSSCAPPDNYAEEINEKLAEYFKEPPTPRPGCGFGTIVMDFAEPDLVRSIIASNFNQTQTVHSNP